jgi:hypothetical protein
MLSQSQRLEVNDNGRMSQLMVNSVKDNGHEVNS